MPFNPGHRVKSENFNISTTGIVYAECFLMECNWFFGLVMFFIYTSNTSNNDYIRKTLSDTVVKVAFVSKILFRFLSFLRRRLFLLTE